MTWARTDAARPVHQRAIAAHHVVDREKTALGGDELEEIGGQPGDADLAPGWGRSAFTCSSAVKTGLRTKRSTSGCVAMSGVEAVEIAATASTALASCASSNSAVA